MAIFYLIRKSTLKEIADAIRYVRGITSHIPVAEFDDVLSGKAVNNTTAGEAIYDLYVIDRQILVNVANVIRDMTGTSDEIPVSEIKTRILALNDLEQNEIAAVLGKAILGKMILGSNTSLNKLGAPTIHMVDIEKLSAPTIEIIITSDEPKLEAPTIYLEADKLETPNIRLEADKLNAPTIYLWNSKLETPVITLYPI